MLRMYLNSGTSIINNNSIIYQSVRWARKPRWMPVAKSKMFRVPVKPVIPREEYLELQRLHNNYKTQERAVRNYIINEIRNESAGATESHMSPEEELADFEQCMKINESWNAEVAAVRNERLRIEALQKDKIIEDTIKKRNEYQLQKLAEVERKVQKMREDYKTFITPENIDSAIEAALSQIVDYNFSIDSKGNMYKGRKTELKQE